MKKLSIAFLSAALGAVLGVACAGSSATAPSAQQPVTPAASSNSAASAGGEGYGGAAYGGAMYGADKAPGGMDEAAPAAPADDGADAPDDDSGM